jgi:uroporphyrin-3 C-methyltransferase/uroporphyrinogen III methyltransferase/synthase
VSDLPPEQPPGHPPALPQPADASKAAAAPASGAAPAQERLLLDRAGDFRNWWTWPKFVLIAVLLLFVWNWWSARSQIDALREEVAQRLRDDENLSKESRILAREGQDRMREALVKMTALEVKLTESQSQQAALEAMYQDLSRNRDEFALSEIEQTLALAAQQLQLAGNVRGALIALQNADARLGRADKAQFIAVRRVLQRDIERLKALPFIDTTGLAIRLDTVIGSVDGLPLIFDEKLQPSTRPGQPPRAPAPASAPAAPRGTEPPKAADGSEPGTFKRLRDEAWDQFKQLVRVRDVENPEPVLLNPQQTFFLRENLKLRLLNARISLLQRNEALFREDMKAASAWMTRYFDVRSRSTASALATINALSASAVSIELPTLADSLNAVRNYRAPPAPAAPARAPGK